MKTAEVDCADRHAACGAHCCAMEIPLSEEERASGRYAVQAERPGFVERVDNGHCTYWRDDVLACGIYGDRPAACRSYSCVGDSRFWRDFDRRIINVKAIYALVHRGPARPMRPEPLGPVGGGGPDRVVGE